MPKTSNDSEQSLKEAASHGNEKAFRELFERYHERLFQYILRMAKSREVAEELTMDVFLKLWLGRDMINEIERLDSFLFRIAYTKTIDFFRSAAKNQKFVDLLCEQSAVAGSSNVHNELIAKEYEEHLRHAIGLLPPRRQMIYELSREQNLSHEEIAGKLGISKSTVANSIVEAKQFIKAYLTDINLLSILPLFILINRI